MVTLFHPQPGTIPVTAGSGAVLSASGVRPNWLLDHGEDSAVQIAAGNLMSDFATVTGRTQRSANQIDEGSPTICLGTLGYSSWIDPAVCSNKLDLTPLKDPQGEYRWEGFTLQVVDGTLYVVGADRRGTIYGIYALSRAIGISPLHWWGNVPARRHERICLPSDLRVFDWPSVRYRGFFINDEEELDDWARLHTPDGTIGPATYEKVFDLILRLGGNYLWPAMHVNAFNDDPRNGRLAQSMGVVIGSSHCDMLLRSNQHEWDPWVAAQGRHADYDYSLPGGNRDMIRRYWSQSVDMNRNYEVTWTLGMRGIHDTGLTTRAIDEDPNLDQEGRLRARVDLLGRIIHDQRDILREHLGRSPQEVPQLFIPYKEVLPLYDAGLDLPEDVTIMWVNDNYGYMRRFPNQDEQARSGGNGVYYHSSYWAPPRTSYRCTSSTPLALMNDQLGKCWDRGIRRVWVDNLGAIKRLELEGSYFLHLAWNADEDHRSLSARDFVAAWFDQTFDDDRGSEAADLCMRYYRINNQSKIEHLHEDSFTQTGYDDEAGGRLAALHELAERSHSLGKSMKPEFREAYRSLVDLKIAMVYYVNAQFYHADRSRLEASRGALPAADRQMRISHLFQGMIRALLHWYNKELAQGCWDGILTPNRFPPPTLPQYPACRPVKVQPNRGLILTPQRAEESVKIAGNNDHARLVFDPYGIDDQWFDLDLMGTPTQEVCVSADQDWIRLPEQRRIVRDEWRIHVRVENASTHAGRQGTLTIITRPCNPEATEEAWSTPITVDVLVGKDPRLERGFTGYVEADGHISMDPSRGRVSPDLTEATTWLATQDLGRFGPDLMQTRGWSDPESGSGACLSLDFWLKTPGRHRLEAHRLPTLNSRGRIRLRVSLDGTRGEILESPTTDEFRGDWQETIVYNAEQLTMILPYLKAGPHRLQLIAVDDSFGIDKIVINTGRERTSRLGPAFSTWVANDRPSEQTDNSSSHATHIDRAQTSNQIADLQPTPTAETLDRPLRNLAIKDYKIDPDCTPDEPVPYFDQDYWLHGGLYTRPKLVWPAGHQHEQKLSQNKDTNKTPERIYLEAADCLRQDENARLSQDGPQTGKPRKGCWVPTDAPTHRGRGLAMRAEPRQQLWPDAGRAPGMNLSFQVGRPGNYRIWLLAQFASDLEDSCHVILDGDPLAPDDLFPRGGRLMTFATEHVWGWSEVTAVQLTGGRHVLTLEPERAGMRIARIYLACDESRPPLDEQWPRQQDDRPGDAYGLDA